MSYITSPNMLLQIPIVGQTTGPEYADNINASLSILDQHDHSAGSGVPIGVAGLNIDGNLAVNNHSLLSLSSANFQDQGSVDASGRSLYVKSVDLFYNDGTNVIQLTVNGAVAGTPGSISNLISPASASYSSGTVTFNSNIDTPANIAAGSILLGNIIANTEYLTLSPPNAMGASYNLTLPPLPAQTNVMTLDVVGNMGSITYDAVGQGMTDIGADAILNSVTVVPTTQANLVGSAMTSTGANAVNASRTMPLGTAINDLSIGSTVGYPGVLNTTINNSTYTSVPLTVTLSVSGRPINLIMQPDYPTLMSGFGISGYISCPGGYAVLRLNKNGTPIAYFGLGSAVVLRSETFIDSTTTVGGTAVYTMDAISTYNASDTLTISNFRFIAYEL